MTETYIAVGTQISPLLFVLPFGLIGVITALVRKRKGEQPYVKAETIALFVYFSVTSIIGLPSEWIWAGMFLLGAVSVWTTKYSRWPLLGKVGANVAAMIGAWMYLSMPIVYGNIALGENSVRFQLLHKDHEVSRQGLKVDVIYNKGSWLGKPWGSWTSFSGDDLGPSTAGFFLYWGPHGLVDGDTVGKRLAEWAHAQPIDETERLGGTRH